MNKPQFLEKGFHRKPRFWLTVLAVIIIILLFRHCQSLSARHKQHPIQGLPVVLATAQTSDVPVYLSALGAVTPTYSVTVRTQINGQLLEVLFTEGQMVKKGDLLAQIDPRPYEAQLIQYEGQYARDQALLANAKIDLQRYQKLWKEDSVAKQILDTQVALVQQDEGTVKIDEGLLASTKLNLYYTRIISPIDGRVGLRLVDPGNYVQTTDTTGIAVINMLNPITVVFTLPEDNIPQVQQHMNANKPLEVKAYDRAQNILLATGKLLTIDNQIDPTTGTVKLKAQFQNDDNHLFPSQFVNVQLLIDTLENATIVPTAAIQHGSQGTFVYLLSNDNTVKVTPIVTGVTSGDNTVITAGVSPGESVVVEGADQLTDGAKVTIMNAKPSSSQTKPADSAKEQRATS